MSCEFCLHGMCSHCIFHQFRRVAARGYGYVACSRFKSRSGCHVYGKLRRSDFLPVGEELEEEVLVRGYDSVSSADSEGCGLEYQFSEGSGSETDALDPAPDQGNLLQEFL